MTDEEIAKQLENYLEQINELFKDCNDGILPKSEAKKIKEIINRVKDILPENSRQYRIFDRDTGERLISQWWLTSSSNYIEKLDCKKFEQLITAIYEVLKTYQPEYLQGDQGKTEFNFRKGEVYEAERRVFEIMKKAEKSLIIMDAYSGQEDIFKYIDSIKQLNENLRIQILTQKALPIFKKWLKDLIKIRGNIEAKKIGNVLHDRYIIIDLSEVWNIGVSPNGIGMKYFTIKKITDKEIIIEWFNELGAKAKNLEEENNLS
jgi:hypothetical protein